MFRNIIKYNAMTNNVSKNDATDEFNVILDNKKNIIKTTQDENK